MYFSFFYLRKYFTYIERCYSILGEKKNNKSNFYLKISLAEEKLSCKVTVKDPVGK